MSDCEHSKVYYMDFANQPRAFEHCPMCQRDAALSRLSTGRKLVADLVEWIKSDELIGENEQSWKAITDRAAEFCAVERRQQFADHAARYFLHGDREPGDVPPKGLLRDEAVERTVTNEEPQ